MAYPYITLATISGTGSGNQWTKTGSTVGDDCYAIDGVAAWSNVLGQRLSVPIDNTTDTTARSCVIQSVSVRIYAKVASSNGALNLSVRTHSTWYDSINTAAVTTTYGWKAWSWTTNPNTSAAWTWAEVDALEAGCKSVTFSNTYYVDRLEVQVTYRNTYGTSTITIPHVVAVAASGSRTHPSGHATLNLPIVTSQATGKKIRSGTSALTLPKVVLSSTGIDKTIGTVALTLPKITLTGLGQKGAGVAGSAHLTLPKIAVATSGYLTHSGYVGGQNIAITLNSTADNTLRGVMDGNPVYDLDQYGANPTLYVRDYNNYAWSVLIKFDVSSLINTKILSAKLTIFTASSLSTNLVRISAILRDWSEGNGLGTNTGYDSTWKYVDHDRTVQWTTKGARSVGNDYDKVYSTTSIPYDLVGRFIDFTGLTELVEKWLSTNNYGLMLWPDQTQVTSISLPSRETVLGSQYIPHMTIEYATTQLPQISVAATGRVNHLHASSTVSLPQVTLAATGLGNNGGTATLTLPQISLVSNGIFYNTGTSTLSLPLVTFACDGMVYDIVGIADVYLTSFELTAVGSITDEYGTADLVLPQFTISSVGIKTSKNGVGIFTLPSISVLALGHFNSIGTSHIGLPGLMTMIATGTVAKQIIAHLTLPQVTLVSTGDWKHITVGNITLPQIQTASNGYLTRLVASAIVLPEVQVSASGIFFNQGTGAITLPQVTLAALLVFRRTGTSSFTLPKIASQSSGNKVRSGNSSLTLPKIHSTSSGITTHIGTSAITLPKPFVFGTSRLTIHGSCNITLPQVKIQSISYLNLVVKTVGVGKDYSSIQNMINDGGNLTARNQIWMGIVYNDQTASGYTLPVTDENHFFIFKPINHLGVNITDSSPDNLFIFPTHSRVSGFTATCGLQVKPLTLPYELTGSIENCLCTSKSGTAKQPFIVAEKVINSLIYVTDSTDTTGISIIADEAVNCSILSNATSTVIRFIGAAQYNCLAQSRTYIQAAHIFDNPFNCISDDNYATWNEPWSKLFSSNYLTDYAPMLHTGLEIPDLTKLPTFDLYNVVSNNRIGAVNSYPLKATSVLTLPKISLSAFVHVAHFHGHSELTLPKVSLSSVGNKLNESTVTLTLPQVTLSSAAVFYNTAIGAINIPQIVVSSTAVYFNSGIITLVLPQILPEVFGHLCKGGPVVFDLPLVEVLSSGYVAHIVHGYLNIPQIIVNSNGHLVRTVAPITLTLPSGFKVNSIGYYLPAGVETWAWEYFKTQLQTNTTLNSFVKTWAFSRKLRILKQSDCPFLGVYPTQTINEEWRSIQTKFTTLEIVVHGKVFYYDKQMGRRLLYAFDEMIKRTIEDISLMNPQITIAKVQDTEFIQLSEYIGELRLKIQLKTTSFFEGSRTGVVQRNYLESVTALPRISFNCSGIVS